MNIRLIAVLCFLSSAYAAVGPEPVLLSTFTAPNMAWGNPTVTVVVFTDLATNRQFLVFTAICDKVPSIVVVPRHIEPALPMKVEK